MEDKNKGSAMDGNVHITKEQREKLKENQTLIKELLQKNFDEHLNEYYEKEKK